MRQRAFHAEHTEVRCSTSPATLTAIDFDFPSPPPALVMSAAFTLMITSRTRHVCIDWDLERRAAN